MEKEKGNLKGAFVERDLSWMYFNHRILQEVEKTDVPVMERMAFLGIYSNNLDEFFRVRMASLNRIALSKDKNSKQDREKAKKTIKLCAKHVASAAWHVHTITCVRRIVLNRQIADCRGGPVCPPAALHQRKGNNLCHY